MTVEAALFVVDAALKQKGLNLSRANISPSLGRDVSGDCSKLWHDPNTSKMCGLSSGSNSQKHWREDH